MADLDYGLIEASEAMGFSPLEIILGVYLKESIPGITRVTMITFVNLIGVTAMAGAIGAGGLGDFAIRYGYQMGYTDMSWITVLIILILISIFQEDVNPETNEAVPQLINIIAARTKDKDNESYKKVVDAYHTKEVETTIKEAYKGAFLCAWEGAEN